MHEEPKVATLEHRAEAAHRWSLLPRLARFFYHLARDRRVPWTVKASVVFAAAYVASPVQLFPDWIPGIGYIDDILLFWIVINYVFAAVPQDVLEEHWGEDVEELRRLARTPPQAEESQQRAA